MKGYMYILLCSNGQYYTGSTNNIEIRLAQHQNGEGSNFTRKHLPVKLVYLEEFDRIDEAFQREKQVQGWSRKKKEALIKGQHDKLPELSKPPSTSSGTAFDESCRLSDHAATKKRAISLMNRTLTLFIRSLSLSKGRSQMK